MLLVVDIAFDFPIRAVDMDGTVRFNAIDIGDIYGTIDLDKELVEATFTIPGKGSAIPSSVISMNGTTTITREGLESVGSCSLFGKRINNSRLFLASNGHGTLTVESGRICGVDLGLGWTRDLSQVCPKCGPRSSSKRASTLASLACWM